jgi:HK97 family phage portal protein
MNLFGLTISRRREAPTGSTIPGDRGAWWHRVHEPFTGAWQRNIEVRTESVLAFSAVYACISRIASDVAKLRIKLVEQQDGIWVETESPSFSPVLTKPNDYQNRIQFLQTWIASKLIHGNAYILKFRDDRQVVVGLYVLDPLKVKTLVAPDGGIYYQIGKDDLSGIHEQVTIPASEVIHDVMNPLYHPLVGTSPIFASGLAATQGLRIQTNSALFFQNLSVPSAVITAPGEITEANATRIKEAWERKFSDGGLGRVAVLGNGLTYEAMAIPASDAQLIEQLRWTREDVCTAFGVPPFMIGVGPSPAYNNIGALNQQYYTQSLQILIESLELCLDEGLGLGTKKDGKLYGTELDLDGLLRMDQATLYKTLGEGVKGSLLTVNEGRRKIDLARVAGGDSIYMQQQNYSLEALAKRDAQDDPFAGSKPPAQAEKPEQEAEPKPESLVEEEEAKSVDWNEVRAAFLSFASAPLIEHHPSN